MKHETLYDHDQLLLNQVAAGDERAFARLFERYADATYGFAIAYTKTKESAEEIVQDIYVKLWMKRAELSTVNHFSDYLFIISRNYILDFLRKNVKDRQYREQLREYFTSMASTPDEDLIFKEANELIARAVETLPAQQKTIYKLRRQEDMPLDAIAEQLQLSPNTVRNHLNRALNTIRAYMEAHSGDAAVGIFVLYTVVYPHQ